MPPSTRRRFRVLDYVFRLLPLLPSVYLAVQKDLNDWWWFSAFILTTTLVMVSYLIAYEISKAAEVRTQQIRVIGRVIADWLELKK